MSEQLVNDISTMHQKFGVNEAVNKLNPEVLFEFLKFRVDFINEEYTELGKAIADAQVATSDDQIVKAADDVVDALIDLVVVALGTLDAMNIDSIKAWDAVLEANMSKSPGSNPTRPNKFSLPDMVKPSDFKSPDHSDNTGLIYAALSSLRKS